MDVISVPFQIKLPLPGPMFLKLYGLRHRIPLHRTDGAWVAQVDLPPGAHPYRFHMGDSAILGDPRRTTQRVIDGDVWSILHVTPDSGPVWVERTFPSLADVQICQGLSETNMPLFPLERIRQADFPVILWVNVRHLYQDALLKVFLVRPDSELAFGGEFLLEAANASADFDLKFWLSLTVEPENAIAGAWTLMVQTEGGPIMSRQVFLQLD